MRFLVSLGLLVAAAVFESVPLIVDARSSPRAAVAASPAVPRAAEVSASVKQALRDGTFPWYDADTDQLRPVWGPNVSWLKAIGKYIRSIFDRLGKFLDSLSLGPLPPISGDFVGTAVLLSVLSAFLVGVFILWLRRKGGWLVPGPAQESVSTAARVSALPEGLRASDGDPWAEAQRRRAAGDLAGAVICLFAHQLLTLDQIGLIRLAPGRTGRHYVKGIHDAGLIDSLTATLGLFEDVYYGRRVPSPVAFEAVWKRAEAFNERRRRLPPGAHR